MTTDTEACFGQMLVISDVRIELLRQLKKWGVQNNSPEVWGLVLGEEKGESDKAALELRLPDRHNAADEAHGYYHELVQTAAVAIAAAENFKRNGGE